MSTIFIGDLPMSVVLAALYNNAVVEGFETRTPFDGRMSLRQAQSIVSDRSRGTIIETLHGRTIGLDTSSEEFDPTLYNAANGGADTSLAETVIMHVKHTLDGVLAEATRDFWVEAAMDA